jgi:hypothetical protein
MNSPFFAQNPLLDPLVSVPTPALPISPADLVAGGAAVSKSFVRYAGTFFGAPSAAPTALVSGNNDAAISAASPPISSGSTTVDGATAMSYGWSVVNGQTVYADNAMALPTSSTGGVLPLDFWDCLVTSTPGVVGQPNPSNQIVCVLWGLCIGTGASGSSPANWQVLDSVTCIENVRTRRMFADLDPTFCGLQVTTVALVPMVAYGRSLLTADNWTIAYAVGVG